MNPVIGQIGGVSVAWYGLIIMGAVLLAAWGTAREAARSGDSADHVWNMLVVCFVFGLLGARLYHVISSPANSGYNLAWYMAHPGAVLALGQGGFRGLGVYGALAGGIAALVAYCLVAGLSPLRFMGYAAPWVLLAQAIGRFGNFVNQELYGPPAALPWAFHINPDFPCQVPADLPPGIQACGATQITQATHTWYAANGFHPTFFYEALWNLCAFLLIVWLMRRHGDALRVGDPFFLYWIAYGVGRFWIEALRPDAWRAGALATAQWIALVGLLIGAIGIILRHRGWQGVGSREESMAGSKWTT